jgi:hypothetical protein
MGDTAVVALGSKEAEVAERRDARHGGAARTWRAAALAALLVALPAAGCDGARDASTERLVEDRGRGCSYVLPPRWIAFDSEMRSPQGSLLEVRVYDLEGAAQYFVEGLPDTLVPKLEEWARVYFVVEGDPARADATVAGVPATELTYPVRVRPQHAPSKLVYWIFRHETKLYVLRAAIPPKAIAVDDPAIRTIVASFRFLGTAEKTEAAPVPS